MEPGEWSRKGLSRPSTSRRCRAGSTPISRTRDFTFNAMAVRVGGEDVHDPHGGRRDLEARRRPCRVRRQSSVTIRCGSCEPSGSRTSWAFGWTSSTESLLRASSSLVTRAGRRTRAGRAPAPVPDRLSPARRGRAARAAGWLARRSARGARRPGVSAGRRVRAAARRASRSHASCADTRPRFSVRVDPEDESPRAIHRFRRATEPWALDALAFLGATALTGAVERARRADPPEPLVRGDELDLAPGPEIGRILAIIDEERAAGTISTREEALELARSLAAREPP